MVIQGSDINFISAPATIITSERWVNYLHMFTNLMQVYFNTRLHPEDAVYIKHIPIAEVCNGKTIVGCVSPCHKIIRWS